MRRCWGKRKKDRSILLSLNISYYGIRILLLGLPLCPCKYNRLVQNSKAYPQINCRQSKGSHSHSFKCSSNFRLLDSSYILILFFVLVISQMPKTASPPIEITPTPIRNIHSIFQYFYGRKDNEITS